MSDTVTLSPAELNTGAERIVGVLERVSVEQGDHVAVRQAIINLHGNVAFLLGKMFDTQVVQVLDDLRDNVLESLVPTVEDSVN